MKNKRKIKNKAKSWYPADDEKKHFKRSKGPKATKLRKGIEQGSVLILLADDGCREPSANPGIARVESQNALIQRLGGRGRVRHEPTLARLSAGLSAATAAG